MLVRSGLFPFLLGGTFIEAHLVRFIGLRGKNFPSFWEGLSLRPLNGIALRFRRTDFPSFWEGLSLRRGTQEGLKCEL